MTASKPRTARVAFETNEYKAWKISGAATKESCSLNVVAFEAVEMIELSAYLKAVQALKVAHEHIGDAAKLMRHLDHAFLPDSRAAQMQSDAHEIVKDLWKVYELVTGKMLKELGELP